MISPRTGIGSAPTGESHARRRQPGCARVRGSFSPEAAVQALAKAKGTAATAPEQDFVGQLLEDYAPGDLPQLTLADFGALALDLWTWCAAHPPLDEPAIG
ncbi:MAG: hypothetical protein WDN45_13680 [Caulobacteraceae bacterium]